MKVSRLALLVAWLAAACAGSEPTKPSVPPPPPAPPPPPPPPPPGQAKPVGYFVSPAGSAEANGTIDHPWSYDYAFAGAGGAIHPGDTVWFRAGFYSLPDTRHITVSGTGETSRVVFKNFPGERAVFEATEARHTDWISVEGNWLTLWGLEFTNTSPDRASDRGATIYNDGNCNRYLSIIVHDGGFGIYAEPAKYGTEIIGSIFYNNGWQTGGGGRTDGHAMYIKSNADDNSCRPGQARTVVRDNVAFNGFAFGIHAYTDRAEGLHGILLEGNVVFNNGSAADVAYSTQSWNLLLGGDKDVLIVDGDTVRQNMSYYSPTLQNPGAGITVGYQPGPWTARQHHAVVTDNYSVGGIYALRIRNWDTVEVRRNVAAGTDVLYLEPTDLSHYIWSGNTYYADPSSPAWYFNARIPWQQWKDTTGLGGSDVVTRQPDTAAVFVRSLAPYVAGRGHIVVYNWGLAPSVVVDLSAVLAPGDSFDVWNVQDLFATKPLLSDIYHGGKISLPMDGVPPPLPLGGSRMPPRTGPAFEVFVVQKR